MIAVRRLNHAVLFGLGPGASGPLAAPVDRLDLPAELSRWSGVRTA